MTTAIIKHLEISLDNATHYFNEYKFDQARACTEAIEKSYDEFMAEANKQHHSLDPWTLQAVKTILERSKVIQRECNLVLAPKIKKLPLPGYSLDSKIAHFDAIFNKICAKIQNDEGKTQYEVVLPYLKTLKIDLKNARDSLAENYLNPDRAAFKFDDYYKFAKSCREAIAKTCREATITDTHGEGSKNLINSERGWGAIFKCLCSFFGCAGFFRTDLQKLVDEASKVWRKLQIKLGIQPSINKETSILARLVIKASQIPSFSPSMFFLTL